MSKKIPLTPSEFYRNRRPEYFSDSQKVQEVTLTKEQFAFELNQITTNQKEAAFETFGRRLAEKLITPNLIPQVGPTGGGDGKTDSDTYTVSDFISNRWFVTQNGWNKNENWAIAISAKKDWKPKVKADVKSIIATNRGYTKIYFISNQSISSKKKKDTQDELKKEFKIDVIILDAIWIIEKTYSNDLINLAVDSLNLSTVYIETIKIGSNDASRIELLKDLERKINDTKRYFEYDYQLVEDALQAALLTRMLEKPKDEVFGKFERALRLGQKINNSQQLARIHYQLAWTYINWYDDYKNFFLEFQEFKKQIIGAINISNLEMYATLINLFRSVVLQESFLQADFIKEEEEYNLLLDSCIQDDTKPTTALTAHTYKLIAGISPLIANDTLSKSLGALKKCFEESVRFLEYPFDHFKEIVEICGELLPNNSDYDNLIDLIAELSEKRASELSAGVTYFTRAVQKFSKNYYKESLIYFGKSVKKLAKEESRDMLYLTMMSLGIAYRHLGLLWASNNSIIAASSIIIQEWYNSGKLSKRLYTCIEEALKNELFIGRIPQLLTWHELFKVVIRQFEPELDENELPPLEKIDACLSVRLLNVPHENWHKHSHLPDILQREELWLSQDAALYTLGYTELIETSHIKDPSRLTEIDDYYNLIANQPFKDQITYATNLLDADEIEYASVILGTHFTIKFKNTIDLSIMAETILAYFESFLATSFFEIYPSTESIIIELQQNDKLTEYSIDVKAHNKHYIVQLCKTDKIYATHLGLSDFLLNLFAKVLSTNFIIKGDKIYLEKLFKVDEVHERLSIILSHRFFVKNIFGDIPKIFLNDWKTTDIKEYPFKRNNNPIKIDDTPSANISEEKIENITHNQTKVSSIINPHLWGQALWKGFGFFTGGGVSLGICFAFQNEQFGMKIFEEWRQALGDVDKEDLINISIIKGVNATNPFWYRVHVSKKMDKSKLKENQFLVSTSRIHEMNAYNATNLTNLITGFQYVKKYLLCPASYKSDGTIEPIIELGIEKASLTIRDAWEIGENDVDAVVIGKDDNPIIPVDKPDAPIINLLELKRKRKE